MTIVKNLFLFVVVFSSGCLSVEAEITYSLNGSLQGKYLFEDSKISSTYTFEIKLGTTNVQEEPVLQLCDGLVQGEYKRARNGNHYMEFLGIPYAKPPEGALRFEEPIPVQPWIGVRKSREPNVCMQVLQFGNFSKSKIIGHEDCLYLNVFTPNLDPNAGLNVIVNIHGGGFMSGSSKFALPTHIMTRDDFVYVSIQFRVGILGFLSTGDKTVPGNNGMKDQILALKWVQRNIHHFGGNASAVTLVGASSGGASVHYHMVSPLSTGLFRNAISSSGTMLSPWALSNHSLQKAKILASNVGCPVGSSNVMVQCLKQRPAVEILEQLGDFLKILSLPLAPFSVTVDSYADFPFLLDSPRNLLVRGKVKDLPWLVTFTAYEGLYPAIEFLLDNSTLHLFNQEWDKLAPALLDLSHSGSWEDQHKVIKQIRKFYLKDKKICRESFLGLVDMISNRWYTCGIEESVLLQSKANFAPVYVYKFNYRGQHSLTDFFVPTAKQFGAAHGDDQFYIFPPASLTADFEDDDMVELMLEIVTSFAKSGKPEIRGIDWKPTCTEGEITYLNINSVRDIQIRREKRISDLEFWKNLPIET